MKTLFSRLKENKKQKRREKLVALILKNPNTNPFDYFPSTYEGGLVMQLASILEVFIINGCVYKKQI